MEILFVYGTLKKGFANHHFLHGTQFLGKGLTRARYCLYEAGLPYLVENQPLCRIKGELYGVSKQVLADIDRLEGHPHFYHRIQKNVIPMGPHQRNQRSSVTAWIYFYPRAIGVPVRSGEYMKSSQR